jgi:hypothetical protein
MMLRKSGSTPGSHAAGRLLTLAVAVAVSYGTAGLSGPTAASAFTGTPKKTPIDQHLTNRQNADPAVNSATIYSLPESPLVFNVSSNGGVPWVRDPRSSPSWQTLNRVPGSGGDYVIDISVAEAPRESYTPDSTTTSALRITARTAGGIFFTVCRLGNLQTLSIPLPTTGPLPCTPWAPVPN